MLAAKARLVVQCLLQECELTGLEIFPKQDELDTEVQYGNFINAPLFGTLVTEGRTVFINPETSGQAYPDQWEFLKRVERVAETVLDEIITINDLNTRCRVANGFETKRKGYFFGLPPCARRILEKGVTGNQRVIGFRLAVHLKRLGFPYNSALAVLKDWATQNRPEAGKRIITQSEIENQTAYIYHRKYYGFGCDDPAISMYCDPECPFYQI